MRHLKPASDQAIALMAVAPMAVCLLVAWVDRDQLPWWQFIVYAAVGSVFNSASVIVGYLAISPTGVADVAFLVCWLVTRSFRRMARFLHSK